MDTIWPTALFKCIRHGYPLQVMLLITALSKFRVNLIFMQNFQETKPQFVVDCPPKPERSITQEHCTPLIDNESHRSLRVRKYEQPLGVVVGVL